MEILSPEEISSLFSNIETIYTIHKQLLEDFTNAEDIDSCIGEIFLKTVRLTIIIIYFTIRNNYFI